MTATVVLVHGAWSGSWTWRAVIGELDRRGIASVAVDLPSCNATAPTVDFHDDARHVRETIDGIDGPVVLVANSYGGLVITEAAVDQPDVGRLVYVAAFMPSPEESLAKIASEAPNPEMNALITQRDDGLFDLDVEADIPFSMQQAPDDELGERRGLADDPVDLRRLHRRPGSAPRRPARMGENACYRLRRVAFRSLPPALAPRAAGRAARFARLSPKDLSLLPPTLARGSEGLSAGVEGSMRASCGAGRRRS
jgi:pimeloyl-ACP methyl ester carboxylesterase